MTEVAADGIIIDENERRGRCMLDEG